MLRPADRPSPESRTKGMGIDRLFARDEAQPLVTDVVELDTLRHRSHACGPPVRCDTPDVNDHAASLAGSLIPILRVTDAQASARWYGAVLRLDQVDAYSEPHGLSTQVTLTDAASGLTLCLLDGAHDHSRFDERIVGLDHLEFVVANLTQLQAWAHHLDRLGIPHSGVKLPEYASSAILTFRDPDNIQLEFYCTDR